MERKARYAFFRLLSIGEFAISGTLRGIPTWKLFHLQHVVRARKREKENAFQCHSKQSCIDVTYPRASIFVAVTCRRWQRFIRVDSESGKRQREREREKLVIAATVILHCFQLLCKCVE